MIVNYTVVNLITFGIGLAFLINGYRLLSQGREEVAVFLMSGLVGFGLILVALIPDIFQQIAILLGLELKARAILVTSNLVLFILATYLLNRLSQLMAHISRLNEELTLLKAEREHRDRER